MGSALLEESEMHRVAPATAKGPHLPELDGMRGLAILLVMAFHFIGCVTPEMARRSAGCRVLGRLSVSGWIGVDLFFVLSGFLITGLLFDSKGSQRYFETFYARRALRIFPLYYGVLLVAFAFPGLGWAPPSNQAWFWLYGVNFLRVLEGPGSCGRLEHFWSLAVEEHFYLAWPLIVLLFRRRSLMWISGLTPLVALAIRTPLVLRGQLTAAYMLTPCRIDAMAVGSFLALAVRGPGGVAHVLPSARLGVLAGGLSLLVILVRRHGILYHLGTEVQTVGYTALALLFGGLLILAIAGPTASRVGGAFRGAGLRFIGKYSYGVYVYHYLFGGLFSRLWPAEPLARALGSDLIGALGSIALSMAASVALALASWHLYEKHFLNLKRFFPYE